MGSGNGVDKSLDLRLIPEFDGSPQQSVVEWLEKLELVCKLRDISDVASVIPLRLTGGAFAVYLQLNAQERSSVDKVKEALLAAFAANPFVAYDQFVSRKLGPDESPDVFLAELKRLATLFGGVSEKALACAFVAGLPENVRQLLRAGSRMEDLGLNQIITRARAIITDERPVDAPNACLSARGPGVRSPTVPPGQRRCVQFGLDDPGVCAAAEAGISIREKDFTATYCPSTRSWTAAWKWSDAGEPGVLRNTVEEYPPANVARGAYEDELRKWIKDGWLVPYDESKHGPPKGLLPLMAVIQRNKKKVRPVMDFRELNAHIESHTADADVCSQKLREWRRQGVNVALIDLKKAYLQIRIDKSLWPYQTVVFKGKRYCLTRLGFGLNVAPLVMKAVLNCVLSRDPDVRKGTSAYIDDILVNESVVAVDRVKRHLAHYGLTCKTHERAADGARLLGLKVWGERGKLMWRRDNDVGEVPDVLTRRSVFSYCGKLVSHFPVCGWLRIAAAYIKRKANDATTSWDEVIDGDELRELIQETALAVKKRDPARGRWDVSAEEAKIWVDASSLAIGVALEVSGSIVEDAAWLRPDDAQHINMAELDAVIRGLNLALSWQMRRIRLMTDSATVHRWVSDGLSGKARLKTKASGEMLIRRRVFMILSLVEEFGLELEVDLVKSACNKADELTRVPRRWLKPPAAGPALVCAATADQGVERMIADVHHAMGHPGIRRTLYFARRTDPTVSKRQVRQVISGCEPCKSLDPAPGKWKRGSLEVAEVWQRVGMDITHVRGRPYLTLIDCGPSRFAVWRRLRVQCSANVTEQLEAVFYEQGAPEELLTDNDTAF
ncbi:conserved hypothetical protein [Trichinella spiralis]|nr:conserved hypothetical protein [Trichinella spiralis]